MKKTAFLVTLFSIVLAGCTSQKPMMTESTAPAEDVTPVATQSPATVDDSLRNQTMTVNFPNIEATSDFAALIKLAELETTLDATGPYTVFIPTPTAFAKLPAGTMEKLTSSPQKKELRAILSDHIVSGPFRIEDLKDGMTLTAVSGKKLPVQVTADGTSVGGAMLAPGAINHSNGFSHMVDSVILVK